MDAVAQMNNPTIDAYIRGHQSVGGILVCRQPVIPYGIRLYVNKEHGAAVGVPFRKTTEVAAQLIRECKPPAGVTVMVLCDAYDRGRRVVQACWDQHVHFASTLKSHRSLFTPGWKLTAGREGTHRLRRRRTEPRVIAKPHGSARDRFVDTGWLVVSTLGPLHVVFSRQGTARKLLGLVTAAPDLSALPLIQTDAQRWTIEQWLKDLKPLLGLGPYQHRPSRAAVLHRQLVCLASALLTHLRLERTAGQGQRTRTKAAHLSTAAAQKQLRRLIGEDLIPYLKEKPHGQSVIEELERLRVA